MRILVLSVPLALMLCAPSAVDAQQQVPRPERPYRGLFGGGPPMDPTRDRHELTLTGSATGGYGDVIGPSGTAAGPGDVQRGTTGMVDGNLRYWFGRAGRSISAEARTAVTGYTDIDPMLGVSGLFRAETPLGRRSNVNASLSVGYDPTLVLGAFTPLQGDVDPNLLPETDLTTGFVGQRSLGTDAGVSLSRRWTPSQNTNVGLGSGRRTYLDDFGYDSRTYSASVGHDWQFSRTTTMRGSYRLMDTSLLDTDDATVPLTDHTLEMGVAYSRRLSATREIYLAGGAGASYVETTNATNDAPLAYWTPAGHGTFRLGFRRSWSASVDYRRGVSVLQGVTLQSFSTDAVNIAAGGALDRRIDVTLSAAYSNGRTGTDDSISRFASYGGVAQLRYALARCCAATATYDYYYYRLQDVTGVPTGVPDRYNRDAIRFGFVVSWPLYGSYSGATERGGGRGRN